MPRPPSRAAHDPQFAGEIKRLRRASENYASAMQTMERARGERVEACRNARAIGLTWREIAEELGLNSAQEAERLAKV